MLKAREASGIVPDDLAEQARGYMPSRVLLTAIELGVFTAVSRAAEPTAEALSEALGTNPRATRILLDALVALGLLAKGDGLFGNGPVAARYLVEGAPDDVSTALKHNLSLWATWSELTEVVRTGEPAQRREMHARGDDWTVPFIAAMHRNAALRAPALVKSVGTTGVRRFLDIGGGSGAYSIAFAREAPALEAEVFDLATVVPIARRHAEEAGLDTRVHTRVGDLRRDSFGEGLDLALLSAICHMLGPDENPRLVPPGLPGARAPRSAGHPGPRHVRGPREPPRRCDVRHQHAGRNSPWQHLHRGRVPRLARRGGVLRDPARFASGAQRPHPGNATGLIPVPRAPAGLGPLPATGAWEVLEGVASVWPSFRASLRAWHPIPPLGTAHLARGLLLA